MAKQARFAMEFCAVESCGKCTPCRLGSTRGVETLDRIIAARVPAQEGALDNAGLLSAQEHIALLTDLCETMKFGSLCALGGFTPYPVMSAINRFPEDFR
jgi:formate dehydrogenase iron-sulfur subunit